MSRRASLGVVSASGSGRRGQSVDLAFVSLLVVSRFRQALCRY